MSPPPAGTGLAHLAELNIGRLHQPIDHPDTAEFADNLEPVNAVADASAGFVWRLQTEAGDATALRPFPDDSILVNMSVWTSFDALRDYVFRSVHTPFLRKRAAWFQRMDAPATVLWWVPAGHRPSLDEARTRLEHLAANGPTPYTFELRKEQPPLLLDVVPLDDPVATTLIGELNAELEADYPEPGSTFFTLEGDDVAPGRGAFIVAHLHGEPVGCAAVRVLTAGEWPERTAEIKRMYVRPGGRGLRIGAALVSRLIDEARALGVRRLVLETGDRQGATLALYQRLGFEPCPCWGDYAAAPLSRCFTLTVPLP